MSCSTTEFHIDGVLICSGPRLYHEYMSYPIVVATARHVAVVNKAFDSIPIRRPMTIICEQGSAPVISSHKSHPDMRLLTIHEYETKNGHIMEADDTPEKLISIGVTMFTGLHYLITKGCRNILGLGVNLELFPDGTYNGISEVRDINIPRTIFRNTQLLWKNEVMPNLNSLGVSFDSDKLSNIKNV